MNAKQMVKTVAQFPSKVIDFTVDNWKRDFSNIKRLPRQVSNWAKETPKKAGMAFRRRFAAVKD